jgi:hypothetical protein
MRQRRRLDRWRRTLAQRGVSIIALGFPIAVVLFASCHKGDEFFVPSAGSGSGGATSSASTTIGHGGATSAHSTAVVHSSSSGLLDGGKYDSCADCVDPDKGATMHECAAEYDACQKDPTCKLINSCDYDGYQLDAGVMIGSCTPDKSGACCLERCIELYHPSPAVTQQYVAFVRCVYCEACKTACKSDFEGLDMYCAAIESIDTACN